MVFVRDPLLRNAATSQILQNLFGLTKAEAHLAQALCTGTTTGAYAPERMREPQHRLFASQADTRKDRLQERLRIDPQVRRVERAAAATAHASSAQRTPH